MFNAILIRYDEIGTKGGNRFMFEDQLVSNIRHAIGNRGKVERFRGRIVVEFSENSMEEILPYLENIPGIASFSPVISLPQDADMEDVKERALFLADRALERGTTVFRVSCNRADKRYPMTSVEMAKEISVHVLKNRDKQFTVSMKDYNFKLEVEIDPGKIYLFMDRTAGVKGLPVGTAGDVLTLLSGGIDSPVAAFRVMRRGARVHYMSFFSPPYTGEESMQKLRDLAAHLKKFQGVSTRLYIVPLIDIQLLIRARCFESYRTVLFRRYMNRFAEKVCLDNNYKAIITGESLAQVASQTLENLALINDAVETVPIIRPLIAYDKLETIEISQKIGTYEISIRQCADSCTAFLPHGPVTRGKLDRVLKEEEKLKPEIDQLFEEALKNMEVIDV